MKMQLIKEKIPVPVKVPLKLCWHLAKKLFFISQIMYLYREVHQKYINYKFLKMRHERVFRIESVQQSNHKLLFTSDWLASQPYFYNQKTGKHSKNINNVIDLATIRIYRPGLYAYFTAGYCVDGATMLRDVRFVRPHSSLYQRQDGSLYERENPDPVLERDWRLKPSQIFELLESKIQSWENSHSDPIYIPTSGGYDSRLLNFFVRDKRRIRSATYGISNNQADSFEVQIAKQLSQRLNTCWRYFPLGNYNRYLHDWYDLYGVSTHAHGMYHMEFHEQAVAEWGRPLRMLSGLIGDIWAGLSLPKIHPANLSSLFYTHGLSLRPQLLNLNEPDLLENYYNRKKEYLAHDRLRIVEAMRHKLLLLSYLTRVPESMGIPAYAPFIEPDLALAMLFLPANLRIQRTWQKKFFKHNQLDFSGAQLNYENVLNLEASTRIPYPEIKEYFKEFVRPELVDTFNEYCTNPRYHRDAIDKKPPPTALMGTLDKLGIVFGGDIASAYRQAMIFLHALGMLCYPIQTLLEERDATNIHG